MQDTDTALIQLITLKTGAVLGEDFSIANRDRLILNCDLTHKICNLYLQGDVELRPLICQFRVESPDLERVLQEKSPEFLERSLQRSLGRYRELYAISGDRHAANLYFYAFYGGIATKFALDFSLPHSLFNTLTGRSLSDELSSLGFAVAEHLLPSVFALVYEDILQSAIDTRITSVERYSQLVRDAAWLEFWQLPQQAKPN